MVSSTWKATEITSVSLLLNRGTSHGAVYMYCLEYITIAWRLYIYIAWRI